MQQARRDVETKLGQGNIKELLEMDVGASTIAFSGTALDNARCCFGQEKIDQR